MPRSATSILPFLIVPLAVFLVHAHSLGNGFHYDDGHSLLRNPHIRSLDNLPAFFSDPRTFSENPAYAMYRPLVLVTYALNYAWGAYNPTGYQLFNLVIHCLVTLLVYVLLKQLQLPSGPSLLGSLLFGLHPVQTEPINYISSRSESLAALFYLGSFCAYLRSGTSIRSHPDRVWFSLSLVAFALALLSKSTALSLPFALLAYELSAGKNNLKSQKNKILKLHLPYWLLGGFYLIFYWSLVPRGIARAGQVRTLSVQFATQTKALIHYLKLTFVPIDMNVYQQFWTADSIFTCAPFASLLVGASLIGIAVTLRSRRPLLIFAIAWFFIILLPTFVIPLHIPVNDHRLYLGIAGLGLVIAELSTRIRQRWPFYLIILLFALISLQRDRVWKDELTLWKDATSRAPLMPETHYNLGHAHHLAGDQIRARQAYERAVQLSPQYARAQANLGAIYRQEERFQEALRALQAALKADPEMVEALNTMGLVYASLEKRDESIALFRKALQLNPDLGEVWYNLGLVYRDKGLMQEAAQALQKALQLDPGIKNRFPAAPK